MNKINYYQTPIGGRTLIVGVLLIMLCKLPVMGQTVSVPVPATQDLRTTNSITRNWKDVAQITYSEYLETDPANPSQTISNAKFIYSEYGKDTVLVANAFPSSNSFRVTDMEVQEDTAYFCGYIVSGSSDIGCIGYFCIPDLFGGRDSFHLQRFRQQFFRSTVSFPEGSLSGYFQIARPSRMEVYKVDKGIHIICVGSYQWSSAICTFVADIAHSFVPDEWWYYIHYNDWMWNLYDVAVTDNYVITVEKKTSTSALQFKTYKKPWSVGRPSSDGASDPQMFNHGGMDPIESVVHGWTENTVYEEAENMGEPRLIHTCADSVALAYITGTNYSGYPYGATVKHFDIDDMIRSASLRPLPHANPNTGTGSHTFPVVPTTQDISLVAEGFVPDGNIVPVPNPNNTNMIVHVPYNRMVNINRDTFPINSCYGIKEIAYDRAKRRVLLLEARLYPSSLEITENVVDAFYINDTVAPVTRYWVEAKSVFSIDTLTRPCEYCISGADNISVLFSPADHHQILGLMGDMHKGCHKNSSLDTFDPQGFLSSSSVLLDVQWSRIEPMITVDNLTPVRDFNAFIHQSYNPTIVKFQLNPICK